MPSTKRTYSREIIDRLARRFDAAPPLPPSEFGSAQLVQTLKPNILAMVGKGYDWNRIATMMSEDGVALSPSVLRKYLAKPTDPAKMKTTKPSPRGTKPGTKDGPKSSRTRAPRVIAPATASTPALNASSSDLTSETDAAWSSELLTPDDPRERMARAASTEPAALVANHTATPSSSAEVARSEAAAAASWSASPKATSSSSSQASADVLARLRERVAATTTPAPSAETKPSTLPIRPDRERL